MRQQSIQEIYVNETLFVERRFALDDQDLVAQCFLPYKAPTGEFQCQWSVAWPDRVATGAACGEDGVQALMLALQSIGIELYNSEEYKAGRITLWLQSDLDLPPAWGAGRLYTGPHT